ncbi:nitrogen fixation protein NifS [Providencia heimbachae]|nr:nitrogen fixation protein NifS [Providencia heimbachae]
MLYGNKADNYISTLQKELQQENLNWCVYKDDTESDIEKLIAQNADLLICIPGLRYQFYTNGFDKKNIIYLSTMEYANSVTNSVIQRIKSQ